MIRLVDDFGPPAAVTAVDLVTQEVAPDWNEWASYLMAGGGYLGGFLGFGGNFAKDVGKAALPLAARHIYARVKATTVTKAAAGRRLAFRPATSVRGTTVPEFADVRVS